jgi:lysophospholipase L1-like esterase
MKGYVHEILLFKSDLTEAQILALHEYLATKYSIYLGYYVVGIGDSQMLAEDLAELGLDASLPTLNKGVGSQTTTQIAARFAADVLSAYPRYVFIQGGVNDLAGGTITQATYIANMTAMIAATVAAGAVPIVCKILPWTAGSNANMQKRDAWSSALQAVVATYPTAIWCDSDTALGQNRVGGDAENLDNVHLTPEGETAWAALLRTKLPA